MSLRLAPLAALLALVVLALPGCRDDKQEKRDKRFPTAVQRDPQLSVASNDGWRASEKSYRAITRQLIALEPLVKQNFYGEMTAEDLVKRLKAEKKWAIPIMASNNPERGQIIVALTAKGAVYLAGRDIAGRLQSRVVKIN